MSKGMVAPWRVESFHSREIVVRARLEALNARRLPCSAATGRGQALGLGNQPRDAAKGEFADILPISTNVLKTGGGFHEAGARSVRARS
jgi:hypothetical protein